MTLALILSRRCPTPVRNGIGAAFLGDGRHAQPSSFRRGDSSGRCAAADNPHVTTVEPEVLTPAGRRWVERTQRPLDLLAVIFLIDVILLWSFPGGPPAFLKVLNVIAWIVWACFAVDYVARLRLSIGKARFVRTHKLDLLMVLLPMLRLLRIFLLLRRSLASVSTEKIAGSIVSLVVAAVFVSAFFMWRVEYNAPGATITTFRYALWWAIVTTTTVGYGDYTPVTAEGRLIATAVMIVGVGLIGTVSATVAAWFVTRHSEPSTETADVASVDVEPAAATTADTQALLLDRLDELAAKQDEIRAMLMEPQRPATNG
jgi:voltage-gated potassium channel